MYIGKVILTVACLVLPLAQFRLYYALYVYLLPKAVTHADKLLVVLIVIDKTVELNDLEITSYRYSYFVVDLQLVKDP